MSANTTTGISFPSLLFLVFLILKLTSVIDWSWWWITAPLWAFLAMLLLWVLYSIIYIICKRNN